MVGNFGERIGGAVVEVSRWALLRNPCRWRAVRTALARYLRLGQAWFSDFMIAGSSRSACSRNSAKSPEPGGISGHTRQTREHDGGLRRDHHWNRAGRLTAGATLSGMQVAVLERGLVAMEPAAWRRPDRRQPCELIIGFGKRCLHLPRASTVPPSQMLGKAFATSAEQCPSRAALESFVSARHDHFAASIMTAYGLS